MIFASPRVGGKFFSKFESYYNNIKDVGYDGFVRMVAEDESIPRKIRLNHAPTARAGPCPPRPPVCAPGMGDDLAVKVRYRLGSRNC